MKLKLQQKLEQIDLFNQKLNSILQKSSALNNENIQLKNQHKMLLNEKNKLIEKNNIAKSKIEDMISRLRTQEGNKA